MNSARKLLDAVRHAYTQAAKVPEEQHPFPLGRNFAESLGYPPDVLARLPSVSIDAFAGVSNVAIFADIPEGATVLDLGCGAGLDSLIAARRVGPKGRVIGVDFSETMLNRARQGAAEAGAWNAAFIHSDAANLPLDDSSVDVALVNGIFNLNPAREAVFGELARVLRPGGRVFAAELILCEPLPQETRHSEVNWFA